MDSTRGSRRAQHAPATRDRDGNTGRRRPPTSNQTQRRHHDRMNPTSSLDDSIVADEADLAAAAAAAFVPSFDRTPNQQASDATPVSSSSIRGPPPNPFRLHRSRPQPRLSMPEISDDSGSEPDLSVIDMARRLYNPHQQAHTQARVGVVEAGNMEDVEEDLVTITDGYDQDEDLEEEEGFDGEEVDEEEEQPEEDEPVPLVDPASMGLKEISNLAKFTVSSHKQGNGVEELRSDDLALFWQSDGPQPHRLTIYFIKRVEIREIRFYVNYAEDESYTPSKIVFKSGTSENNLIKFAEMIMDQPVGWQQVSLEGAGGGLDGNSLVSYVLQLQVLENHQNGKDTHLRGIKIYALDGDSNQRPVREQNGAVDGMAGVMDPSSLVRTTPRSALREILDVRQKPSDFVEAGFTVPVFMREPELR